MQQGPVHRIHEFHAHDPDFYVNILEDHIKSHAFIEAPHKHDFYFCVLFTAGSGTHFIDFKRYAVKPGAVFFLAPGQLHHWNLSTDAKGYIFFHSAAFFDLQFQQLAVRDFPFYDSIYQRPVLYLGKAQQKNVVHFLDGLYKEEGAQWPFKKEKQCTLMALVYIGLSRIYQPGKKAQTENKITVTRLRQLENFIATYFREQKSPSFYAGQMGMSLKHLNRTSQEGLDKTVSQMIADRVLLEAKRLLVHGSKTVGQVADELGYFDHSYFNRFFKRHAGKTPLEFLQEKRA